MKAIPLSGFSQKPDQGKLKRAPSEYENLQNISGRGSKARKRQGVTGITSLSTGIMGFFDMKVDGDPQSNDSVMVFTHGGDWVLYAIEELLTTFDILMATGVTLYMQSPDLVWWSCAPDSSMIFTKTAVAAPASYTTADFNVALGQIFGFADSTGITRIYSSGETMYLKRYATAPYTTLYSTTLAIGTGYGIVFEESDLNRVRYSVDNSGLTQIDVIA